MSLAHQVVDSLEPQELTEPSEVFMVTARGGPIFRAVLRNEMP